MKKILDSLFMIVINILPLLVGVILNSLIIKGNISAGYPLTLIAVLMYLAWMFLTVLMYARTRNRIKTVTLMNVTAAVVLALLFVQECILRSYFINYIGIGCQLYYVPFVRIGFILSPWGHGMFSAYLCCFVLMILVCFAGTLIRKRH